MFQRLQASMAIAKSSWRVLQTDKGLIVFPLLSGAAGVLVIASFLAPILLIPDLRQLFVQQGNNPRGVQTVPTVIATFLFYVVNYFVIVYFNSALISCALIRFGGGEPTLGAGLKAANSRLPQIFAWALFSATVGTVLKVIESKADWLGRIVIGFVGAAWTFATFFVVPALVVERLGPIDALRRSSELVRRTWGERLALSLGMGLASLLAVLPGIGLVGLGIWLFAGQQLALAAAICVGLGVMELVVASAALGALQGIFTAALYHYAVRGTPPEFFDRSVLQLAFAPKR